LSRYFRDNFLTLIPTSKTWGNSTMFGRIIISVSMQDYLATPLDFSDARAKLPPVRNMLLCMPCAASLRLVRAVKISQRACLLQNVTCNSYRLGWVWRWTWISCSGGRGRHHATARVTSATPPKKLPHRRACKHAGLQVQRARAHMLRHNPFISPCGCFTTESALHHLRATVASTHVQHIGKSQSIMVGRGSCQFVREPALRSQSLPEPAA
jgi:hypothetical protein